MGRRRGGDLLVRAAAGANQYCRARRNLRIGRGAAGFTAGQSLCALINVTPDLYGSRQAINQRMISIIDIKVPLLPAVDSSTRHAGAWVCSISRHPRLSRGVTVGVNASGVIARTRCEYSGIPVKRWPISHRTGSAAENAGNDLVEGAPCSSCRCAVRQRGRAKVSQPGG